MKVELRSPAAIRPYEKNPRVNDAAVDAVAESIRQFGFRQPIVVDEAGVIVVGHTRWKAAQKLGLDTVPVHVARDLTPEQAKAYRIADNKTADLATWNLELLPLELAELQSMDIDLSLLGFNEDELAQLLDPGIKEGQTTPDRKFDINRVACLGCCALAPVVKVDDEIHSQVSVLELGRLMDEYDQA